MGLVSDLAPTDSYVSPIVIEVVADVVAGRAVVVVVVGIVGIKSN